MDDALQAAAVLLIENGYRVLRPDGTDASTLPPLITALRYRRFARAEAMLYYREHGIRVSAIARRFHTNGGAINQEIARHAKEHARHMELFRGAGLVDMLLTIAQLPDPSPAGSRT